MKVRQQMKVILYSNMSSYYIQRFGEFPLFIFLQTIFLFSKSNMQQHDAWLSNRGYLKHMEVLKKIQTRRTNNNLSKASIHHSFEQQRRIPLERKTHEGNHPQFTRSKDCINIRQQQILWDNYYLGKRIIETPPVISKRRLDEDYRKHRRLVQCMTASNSRKFVTTDFRVKKLLEYKQNVEKMSQDRAISTAKYRYYIKIQIKNLGFYRQKPVLDQLDLVFSHSSKDGKIFKQTSESFPAGELLDRHFYFSISKKIVQRQQPLSIELRNLKGLTELSVAYFSFPSIAQLSSYKAQMFHCGKPIGQVEIDTSCGMKQDMNKLQQIEQLTE